MAGKTDYKNNWQAEHRDKILLLVPKGRKSDIKVRAAMQEKSVNQYITDLIEQDMNKDRP